MTVTPKYAMILYRSDLQYPPTTFIEICSVINDGILALCSTSLEVGETVRLRAPEAEIDLWFRVAWVRHSASKEYRVAMVCHADGILVWDSQGSIHSLWIRTEGVRDRQQGVVTDISARSISFRVAQKVPIGRIVCSPSDESVVAFDRRLMATSIAPSGDEFVVECGVRAWDDWECLWEVTVPQRLANPAHEGGGGLERHKPRRSLSQYSQAAIVTLLSLFVPAFM